MADRSGFYTAKEQQAVIARLTTVGFDEEAAIIAFQATCEILGLKPGPRKVVWQPMDTAPQCGRAIRLKTQDGDDVRACWWFSWPGWRKITPTEAQACQGLEPVIDPLGWREDR